MRPPAPSFDGRTTRNGPGAREWRPTRRKFSSLNRFRKPGRALLRERDDIDLVEFPNMISAGDFEAMLKEQAPVHGVALGATRFGEPELEASQRHEGGGADRRRLRRRRCSGAEPPQDPADGRRHRQFAVGRRAGDVHDADAGQARASNCIRIVKDGKWASRLGMLPYRSVRQDRADRRLRPHRHPHRQALPGHGNERAGLRSLQAGRRDQGGRLRAGRPISMRRCRAPISSASTARRRRRRSACSTRRGWRA